MKKVLCLIMAVVFFLSPGTLRAAEDIYYLTNEIRETEAKYNAIHASAQKARNFLAKYNEMVAALSKAYDELNALEEKMRDLLQKNLVKSTIVLGFETYNKATLVLGFAEQSAKLIILSIACEYVGDQMQDSFGAPYNQAVKGLSEEARKLAPELAEVQKTLAMSMDEVKAEALKGGDKLGDVGAIYRKFSMVLEAIEKAKKKIYELRKNLDKTNVDVKDVLPKTEEEEKQLEEKLKQLRERLAKAEQEKLSELNKPVEDQVSERSKVQLSPRPFPVMDEAKRQALIDQKQGELNAAVVKGQKELEELTGRYNEAAKVPQYDGGFYNPLQFKSAVMPMVKSVTEKELKGIDPQTLMQEKEWAKTQIGMTTKLIKTVGDYAKEYAGLESSIKGAVTPIMNDLAGLGAAPDNWYLNGLLKELASASVSMPMLVNMLKQEIDILQQNIPKYDKEFQDQANSARAFAAEFETASAAVVNAASMAAAKATELLQEGEAIGLTAHLDGTDAAGYNRIRNKLKNDIMKMIADGETGSAVRAYIDRAKTPLTALYEKAAKVPHLVRLRDNTRSQFDDKYMSDPRLALARRFYELYPEQGIKDPSLKYGEQYWQYQTPKNTDAILGALPIANNAYALADQMNDLLPFLDKIDDINRRVRELYNSIDYPEASRKAPEIVAELNADRVYLNEWLASYGSPDGKTPGMYKIFSKETQEAISASEKRFQSKEGADIAAKAEEDLTKQQEAMRKQYRDEGRLAELYGFSVMNARVNTVSLERAFGDVVLTNTDLKGNAIEITGRLTTLDKAGTILISEDGGRVWKEIALSQDISYAFMPIPDRLYQPLLKIKTTDSEEVTLKLFPNINGIMYRNIDYNQLIVAVVKALADSYEKMSVSAFATLISRDFLGNRTFLEEGVRFDFDMFTDIRLQIFINRIERRAGMYVAETKWDKTQVVRKTGQQQRTSGYTTMMFVLEDGAMKIQNLRGNLIYATLSPEIAESSGLSQTIVEEIAIAQQTRTPVQPGAGQTEQSGGVSLSQPVQVRTGTVHSLMGPISFSFDFVSGSEGASGAGDVDFETNLFFPNGSAQVQNVTGTYTFEGLGVCPNIIPAANVDTSVGNVIIFMTNEGYFGKLKITSLSIDGFGTANCSFQYAVQTNGTRNIATQ